RMAKQSSAEPQAAGPSGAARGKSKKRRKKRKALGEAAAASKGPGMAAVGPPRDPQEFSSNWKRCRSEGTGGCGGGSPGEMGQGSSGAVVAVPECSPAVEGTPLGPPTQIVLRLLNVIKSVLPRADIWFDDVDPKDIEAALGPEAAKIARRNLGLETEQCQSVEKVLVKEKAFDGLTRAVAMDCEMVGVGPKGEDSILARVSIVNQFGKCVYDKYVKPTEKVTDYRTAVSGIRPQNINSGEDFKTVQKEVAEILQGRILVGHALRNDLKVLLLDHPHKKIRDTQRYKPFKERVKSSRPSLKLLCEKLLNVQVQTAEHCSIQDAQAAMRLYTLEKKKWEAAVKNKANKKNCKT
uniref:RNA exonuclease 4 n=1 Tax=Serinus canaria TaxID=9135 RepID=A0A8C9MK71_SERCA